MSIINEESVLKQKYIRDGMTPADAYRKAVEVMEIRDDSRAGNPDMPEAELLRQAEQEWSYGEDAIRDVIGRVERKARLVISRTDTGFALQRGRDGIELSDREATSLIDHVRGQLAAARKAQKAAQIHRLRQAEGRPPWGAVVAGRNVETAA